MSDGHRSVDSSPFSWTPLQHYYCKSQFHKKGSVLGLSLEGRVKGGEGCVGEGEVLRESLSGGDKGDKRCGGSSLRKCNIIDIPRKSQGSEEYEFYEWEGFERWSGDIVFPSAENVVSHDLDLLKWRPSEATTNDCQGRSRARSLNWCSRTTIQPNPTMSLEHLSRVDLSLENTTEKRVF
jgi:hypothetical protein